MSTPGTRRVPEGLRQHQNEDTIFADIPFKEVPKQIEIIVRGDRGDGKTLTMLMIEQAFQDIFADCEYSPVRSFYDEGTPALRREMANLAGQRLHGSQLGILKDVEFRVMTETAKIGYRYAGLRTPLPVFQKGQEDRIAEDRSTGKGYHITPIERGEYGEFSKIEEELAEAKDAREQGCKIMELVELSDLIGAIDGYLTKHHPTTTIDDLITMSAVTGRVFEQGGRS